MTAKSRSGFLPIGIVTGVVLAAAIFAPAAEGAGFKYRVRVFDYDATANVFGDQGSGGCQVGHSSFWGGEIETPQPDLIPVPRDTSGTFFIRPNENLGHVTAVADYQFDYYGVHTIDTNCTPGEEESEETTCPPTSKMAAVTVDAGFSGKPGKKLKIDWTFSQSGIDEIWMPNDFYCEESMPAGHGPCVSKAPFETFKKKTFILRFSCSAQVTEVPPGTGWDHYTSNAFVNGYVALKRTGRVN